MKTCQLFVFFNLFLYIYLKTTCGGFFVTLLKGIYKILFLQSLQHMKKKKNATKSGDNKADLLFIRFVKSMHVQPFICCNTENIWILYISIYQHMKYDTFYLMWQEMWLRGAFDKFDRIIKNYILQSICKWVFPQYVTVTSRHADTRFSSVFSSGLNGALVQETGSYLQKLWKPYHDWQSLVVFFPWVKQIGKYG